MPKQAIHPAILKKFFSKPDAVYTEEKSTTIAPESEIIHDDEAKPPNDEPNLSTISSAVVSDIPSSSPIAVASPIQPNPVPVEAIRSAMEGEAE